MAIVKIVRYPEKVLKIENSLLTNTNGQNLWPCFLLVAPILPCYQTFGISISILHFSRVYSQKLYEKTFTSSIITKFVFWKHSNIPCIKTMRIKSQRSVMRLKLSTTNETKDFSNNCLSVLSVVLCEMGYKLQHKKRLYWILTVRINKMSQLHHCFIARSVVSFPLDPL